MKEFLKWLGVNEKVAKIAVWIFIFMVFLIVANAALDSLGLPYYKVTVENLSKIDIPVLLEYLLSWLIVLLNFLSFTLLIFDIKYIKQILLFGIIYILINVVSFYLFGYAIQQIIIILYLLAFSYFYSGKKLKYILYMVISIILNAIIQYVCYLYKVRFINFAVASWLNQFLTSLDYFLILLVIVVLKELYLKNKKEVKL